MTNNSFAGMIQQVTATIVDPRETEIIELRRQGLTLAEIAAELRCNRDKVSGVLVKNGMSSMRWWKINRARLDAEKESSNG